MRAITRIFHGGAFALVALGPCVAAAADLEAFLGLPRVSFDVPGTALVRSVSVAYDAPRFGLDLVTRSCAAGPLPYAGGPEGTMPCSHGSRSPALQGHDASATFKLPVWAPGAPSVDLSVRSWSDSTDHDGGSGRGTAAEVQLTQLRGRYELLAGYAYPLRGPDGWRSAWAGVAMRLDSGTRLRLLVETATERDSRQRDRRYTLQATRRLAASLRFTSSITRAPDDVGRHWRAAVGLEWPF